ncbi:MAG: hypothetical protein WKG32_18015 [Gemmatimonadaceae bacterium]
MTTKERVHRLVDMLPARELETAARVLEGLAALSVSDPVARALALAPEDDEPETDEERAAVAEARAEMQRGGVIPHADVRRELLGE